MENRKLMQKWQYQKAYMAILATAVKHLDSQSQIKQFSAWLQW